MEYKTYKFLSYNIHTCKTDRFKDCVVEFIFRRKYDKNNVIKRIMLADILNQSSKKYKNRKAINEALEDLYCTTLRGVTSDIADNSLNNYILGFVNPKYLDEDISIDKILKPIIEIIFNPNIKDDNFKKDSFDIVYNSTKSDFLSELENPLACAYKNFLGEIDKDIPMNFRNEEAIKQLDNIKVTDFYSYYLDCLENNLLDIFVVGDLNMERVVKSLNKMIPIRSVKDYKLDFCYNTKSRNKPVIKEEKVKIPQSSIFLSLVAENLTEREKRVVMPFYNHILGGSPIESKLGKKVRQDSSYCYQIKSDLFTNHNLITIKVNLAKKNIKPAIKLIKECIKDMSNKIIDEEIEHAKKKYELAFDSVCDSNSAILNNYIFEVLDNRPRLDELRKMYNNITKKEIYDLSKKMKLTTIYKVIGDDSNENV